MTGRAAALGRPPTGLVVAGAVAGALLVLPLVTLVLATPWSDFTEQLGSPAVADALRITALASLVTVVACLVLGTPLAWLLARVSFPGRDVSKTARPNRCSNPR